MIDRRLLLLIAGALLGVARPTSGQSAPAPSPAPTGDAAARVIADARAAVGGEARLAAVKTFVVTGRTRQVRGDNLVPIEFEIQAELPDRYARRDEFPAQDAGPTVTGFNADRYVQSPAPQPPPARPGGPPPPTPQQVEAAARAQLANAKQDFARLMLGLFATSYPSYPLTFAYAGQAEAPQGRADVLDAKGEGNFALRFFINSETRLPIMVSWTTPPTNVIVTVPGQPPPASVAPGAVVVAGPPAPPAGAPKDDTDRYSKEVLALRANAQATPVEHRLYFADYREVDGVKLPFRLRRAIGTETTEETTFDRFRVNARIDPRKFEPVK